MNHEVDLDGAGAMRQAVYTAEHYLIESFKILKQKVDDDKEWTVRDAIELTKTMAQDYHTAYMCIKMQEIRDVVSNLLEHNLESEAFDD